MTSANSISNLAVQLMSTSNLQSEQTTLAILNQQLATGVKYSDLTDYAPADAHNLLDFQNAITQKQAYISGMKTVNTRLSIYDATMTDMESLTSGASTLAAQNATLNAGAVTQINAQVQNYLKQVTDDLNQQVGGRYIYAGSRYSTAPVVDLSTLSTVPTLPFTPVTNPALPTYDSEYVPTTSLTVNAAPASTANVTIGNVSINWGDLESGNVTSVTVGGVATPVTITGLTASSSPAQLASNLQNTINQLSTQVSSLSTLSATSTGGQVTLNYTGNPLSITPDSGGTSTDITWANGTVGTTAEQMATTDPNAYTQDSVSVDSGYNVQYGVTSLSPGFQQMIAGLQLMNAATQPGVDATTYQTQMNAASTLLNQGLANIQNTHATVAANINTLTQETTTQNTDITNLQNQIGDIQQVDLTTVGTEVNLLQTQLQASYSATASIEQLSLVKYL